MSNDYDRVSHVSDRRQLDARIDELTVGGYEVHEHDGDAVTLVRMDWGSGWRHVLVALLTAWWTFFLGNVVYALYRGLFVSDTLRVVVDESDPYEVDA